MRRDGLARVLLITKPAGQGTDQATDETSILSFDGERYVSSEEIIDQPTIRCKEGHSGHNRNCQFETGHPVFREAGADAQQGNAADGRLGEAGEKARSEDGAQAPAIAGASPDESEGRRGNLWPRLS